MPSSASQPTKIPPTKTRQRLIALILLVVGLIFFLWYLPSQKAAESPSGLKTSSTAPVEIPAHSKEAGPAFEAISLSSSPIQDPNAPAESTDLASISLIPLGSTSSSPPLATSEPSPRHAGPLKIGLLNFDRIYREYHGTAAGEKVLDEKKEKARVEVDKRLVQFNRLRDEFNAQQKQGTTPTTKAEDLAQIRKDISDFSAERLADMAKQLEHMRTDIIAELQAIVTKIAIQDGYDLVLDKSGRSTTGIEILLISRVGIDFTDAVLVKANP
jgi:Skp family chaperone for outer membrane proteins